MSVITEFGVPAESFALAHTLDAVPDVRVESDRLATHSREWVLPFVWIRADDQPAVRAALDDDSTVDDYRIVQETDGETLYNVFWAEGVIRLVDTIADQHGIVLAATAADDAWQLRIRFVDRNELTSFREYFRDHGDEFELHRIVTPEQPRQRAFDLTAEQYEALVRAVESGYYDVPRRTTMADLADALGISPNAVSERLRRATATLVENAIDGGRGPRT